MLPFSSHDVLAIAVVASFAAGLNVYATVATLGLLAHFHAVQLPSALSLLDSWPVIGVSGVLFALGFFADKVPVFDLIWNALNTFVRVPVAALLSFGAAQHLSPGGQVAASALGGLIALASHSGKIAIRAAVTPSPEPFSNMALSFGEDVAAISLTWFATRHPIMAAVIVAICLVLIFFAVRYVVRALRRMFQQALAYLHPNAESDVGTGSL